MWNDLIWILIFVIAACFILWIVQLLLAHLPMPEWLKTAVIAVVALLLLIYLLQHLGLFLGFMLLR